jgi:hypothetical protein
MVKILDKIYAEEKENRRQEKRIKSLWVNFNKYLFYINYIRN